MAPVRETTVYHSENGNGTKRGLWPRWANAQLMFTVAVIIITNAATAVRTYDALDYRMRDVEKKAQESADDRKAIWNYVNVQTEKQWNTLLYQTREAAIDREKMRDLLDDMRVQLGQMQRGGR